MAGTGASACISCAAGKISGPIRLPNRHSKPHTCKGCIQWCQNAQTIFDQIKAQFGIIGHKAKQGMCIFQHGLIDQAHQKRCCLPPFVRGYAHDPVAIDHWAAVILVVFAAQTI